MICGVFARRTVERRPPEPFRFSLPPRSIKASELKLPNPRDPVQSLVVSDGSSCWDECCGRINRSNIRN